MIRPHHSIADDPGLTTSDVLEAFDELTRAVLLDRGLDPEKWEDVAGVVEEAFSVWLRLDAPYVAPAKLGPGPDAGRAA